MLVKYSASAVCPNSTMCFDVWKTDWWLSFGSDLHGWTLKHFSLTRLFRNGRFGEVLDIFQSYWISFSFLSDRSGWSGIKATINPSPRTVGNGILLTGTPFEILHSREPEFKVSRVRRPKNDPDGTSCIWNNLGVCLHICVWCIIAFICH